MKNWYIAITEEFAEKANPSETLLVYGSSLHTITTVLFISVSLKHLKTFIIIRYG